MIYGYARVSTREQTLDAQLAALAKAGAEQLLSEKQSGAKTDRMVLARLLSLIRRGDVIMVTRLDRLARSTRDLLNTLAVIGERGASFRSLADSWCDTTTAHGRLMLAVLGGIAEFERELIRARVTEGRRRAVENGVRLGRRPKLKAARLAEALQRRAAGEPLSAIARSYNVSADTIRRLRQP